MTDWHQIVFSDESRFNLDYNDGRIRVRRYCDERHHPACIVERHTTRTVSVMVWGAISYQRRSRLLRIEGTLNSDRYIREVVEAEVVSFLQHTPGAIFQQDNARSHVVRNVQAFFLAQQILLLPWPAHSPDMSPIEHIWNMIKRRLAHYPSPAITTNELWTRIEAAWQSISQEHIQRLFDSLPRRLEALITARGSCTKY